MAQRNRPPTTEPHIERPGPAEFRDPLVRREMVKAAVWFGMALVIVAIIVLGQPLLLIVGGAIFAVFLDGGTRLLGHFQALHGDRIERECAHELRRFDHHRKNLLHFFPSRAGQERGQTGLTSGVAALGRQCRNTWYDRDDAKYGRSSGGIR